MTTSWSRWTFALGMAAAVTMATGAVQAAENEPAGDAAKSRADAEVATPTHRQTQLIKVNDGERSATQLNSFATTPDGRILAGCGSSNENGEVRVFDAEGNYVETWSSPVRVEAIGVRAADGVVFIAGNGRLVKLDPEGAVLANEPSPHATLSKDAAEKIREQVIEQSKRMVTNWERQIAVYEEQLQRAEKTVEELQAKLDELADDDVSRSETEAEIKKFQNRVAALQRNRDLWKKRVGAMTNTEPSEEQIQKQIAAQIAGKLAVASISAVGDTVYVACSDTVGYGYGVWKIDDKFKEGEQIVSGLRGCCGQMDVQACESGIYVAENARHRVACFDTNGKETTSWGGSATGGAEGFSSCCNPMNVAFGQDGSVFTAESTSGRIKQYSPDGKLQQVVGTVDLVPGCKKVSIGIGQEGQRVYMLDITRNHIVVMEPIPTSDREAMIEEALEREAPEADEQEAAEATASRATEVQAQRIGRVRRAAATQADASSEQE